MIVDFQHHFTPRELIRQDPGDRLILNYDAHGAPSYTVHSLLYDLDEHVRMMDVAGIDAAWLTSAAGMCADLDTSRLVNDKAKQAERDYPGRFIGAAHAHPLGGAAAFKELARCRHELGFQGVVITSEFDGKWIDDPAIEPFWNEVEKLGLFRFVVDQARGLEVGAHAGGAGQPGGVDAGNIHHAHVLAEIVQQRMHGIARRALGVVIKYQAIARILLDQLARREVMLKIDDHCFRPFSECVPCSPDCGKRNPGYKERRLSAAKSENQTALPGFGAAQVRLH